MEPSYASGHVGHAAARRDDRRQPRPHDRALRGPRGARLRPPGAALHLRAVRRGRGPRARARSSPPGMEPGDRVGIWSPNCAEWALVQYATAKAGIILVNINPAYRTSELEYVLNQSGCRLLVAATAFKTSDYVRWSRTSAATATSSSRSCSSAATGRSSSPAASGSAPTSCGAPGRDPVRRPDQHPVHERHHRLPQGRDAQPPQHPQQRLLRRPGLPLHRGGPGLHPGALLPLLRHGHGQPRAARRTARAWSSRRRRSSRWRRCRRCRTSAARGCTACRRCSSPSSSTRRSRSST